MPLCEPKEEGPYDAIVLGGENGLECGYGALQGSTPVNQYLCSQVKRKTKPGERPQGAEHCIVGCLKHWEGIVGSHSFQMGEFGGTLEARYLSSHQF